MTLLISPKLVNSIRNAFMKPVVVARIVTGLIDRIYELYTDFIDSSPGNVLSEHRTAVIKENELTANPQSYIEMLYPNQPGDPVEEIVGFKIESDQVDTVTGILNNLIPSRISTNEPFQTFTIRAGSRSRHRISSVILRLKKDSNGNPINVRTAIHQLDPKKMQLGLSNQVSSNDITTSLSDITFTFSPPVEIDRGKQYMFAIGQSGILPRTPDNVYLETYTNQNIFPGESAGMQQSIPIPKKGLEFNLNINILPYSYDGANSNHRKLKYDFGSIPAGTGYIEANYEKSGDANVQFRLWGSDTGVFADGSPTDAVDLGLTDNHTLIDHGHDGSISHVHDGDIVQGLYRYYAIDIVFSSASLLWSALIHRIGIAFASRQRLFSTDNIPALGTIPAISDIPSIPTKLDVKGYISQTQKWELRLIDLGDEATEMGAETHLKNTTVELFLGSLLEPINSLTDLIPYAAGKVTDFSLDRGELKLSVQDRSKDMDIKLPKPLSTGAQAPDSIDYSIPEPTHFVDVLDDLLFNRARIPRRYQDVNSFKEAKDLLGDSWITSRIITEQTELKDLISGILEITGLFIVHTEDGRMKLVQWPRTGTSTATWDDSTLIGDAEQLPSFEDSVINQCVIKYNHDGNDFTSYFGVVDAQAQADLAPGSAIYIADRLIETEWVGGDVANGHYIAQAAAQRTVRFSKEGIIRHKVITFLSEFTVQVGDLITLKTPVFLEKGRRSAVDGVQVMIISKSPNFKDGTIEWEVVEAIPTNHPPIVSVIATPSEGLLPLTVGFDITATDPDGDDIISIELDPDYDGKVFRPTTIGSPISHTYAAEDYQTRFNILAAVRVTDEFGAFSIVTKPIRFFLDPVARITILQTDPTQPLNAELTGADSTPGSSEIIEYAWDLDYNGTFVSDVTGITIKVSTHNLSLRIALRVTDLDGLTNTTEITISGKTFPPLNPTGFRASQVGEVLVFNWDANPDVDLFGYELRMKFEPTGEQTAIWETSTIVNEEILSNQYLMPLPNPAGVYTFLLKAIDSTGNRSVGAATFQVEVAIDVSRQLIYSQDEAGISPAWPGSPTNLIYKTEGTRWWIARTEGDVINDLNATEVIDDLDATLYIEDLGGPLFGIGLYLLQTIDLGAIIDNPRLYIVPSIIQNIPEHTAWHVYYATSDDDITYNLGVEITGSADIGSCRYLHVFIALYSYDGVSNIALDGFQTVVDKPVPAGAASDATISISDITTNDVSITAHGFAPKAPNDATKYLDGTGSYSVPPAGSGAPTDADYLVGTAHAGLSAEIVVGTSPGGELGGTWASPTVDATHSGSSHAATQAAAESTASGALSTHAGAADPHSGYRLESANHSHASSGAEGGTLSGYVPVAAGVAHVATKIVCPEIQASDTDENANLVLTSGSLGTKLIYLGLAGTSYFDEYQKGLWIEGNVNAYAFQMASNLTPLYPNTQDLGSGSSPWHNLYIGNILEAAIIIGGEASGGNMLLYSTYHSTKGKIYLGVANTSWFDEPTSVLNMATGYQIAGDAPAGDFLRGDGTNYVSSPIQAGDVNDGASPHDTTKFLRGDGTWAAPPGGGQLPVGFVFISVVSTNPGTLLGYGTWTAFGAGRVLVGLDSGDTDFDTVEETGGAKTVASTGSVAAPVFTGNASTVVVNHLHTLATGTGASGNFSQVVGTVDGSSGGTGGTPTQTALGTLSGNPTAGGAANYTPAGSNTAPAFTGNATSVVQPYVVVYMFLRTA